MSVKGLICTYEQIGTIGKLLVKRKLLDLKLEEGDNLLENFEIFKNLMKELRVSKEKLSECEMVNHLLLKLPRSYDGISKLFNVVSEEKLTIEFVQLKLLLEFNRYNDVKDYDSKTVEVEACRARIGDRMKPTSLGTLKFVKHNIKCSKCNKIGHFSYDCGSSSN